MKPIFRPRMLSARSRETLQPIPAAGSAAKYSGRSQVKCPGWSDTYPDMDLNLHTIVSWRAVECGSALRLVQYNTLYTHWPQGVKYFWSTEIFLVLARVSCLIIPTIGHIDNN